MKDNPYTEHLKMARRHRKKLERIAEKLTEMSIDWADYDGCLESELCDLADKIYGQLATFREVSKYWRKGYAC
ncbi:hypothetical protein FYD92_14610 [Salmonella enterica]|nr:hypothetical protein [Salmonella enterica]